MFKVGDKVRCVSTHPGGVNLTVGKVYTVVEVGGDEIGTSVRNDICEGQAKKVGIVSKFNVSRTKRS